MAEEEQLAEVKIFRFDPDVDAEERYDTFQVPYLTELGTPKSVREVIRYIFENIDSSICWYHWHEVEGTQRCKTCMVMVNDKPVLACGMPAMPKMKIDPHPKFKLQRDLKVDFTSVEVLKQ